MRHMNFMPIELTHDGVPSPHHRSLARARRIVDGVCEWAYRRHL